MFILNVTGSVSILDGPACLMYIVTFEFKITVFYDIKISNNSSQTEAGQRLWCISSEDCLRTVNLKHNKNGTPWHFQGTPYEG